MQIYLNKERFNALTDKRYKRRNAKMIKDGCIWYLKKSHLLKCIGWDNLSLQFIDNMKENVFYCFNFVSNKDFTGWLYFKN